LAVKKEQARLGPGLLILFSLFNYSEWHETHVLAKCEVDVIGLMGVSGFSTGLGA
jgi:hypothetical protein